MLQSKRMLREIFELKNAWSPRTNGFICCLGCYYTDKGDKFVADPSTAHATELLDNTGQDHNKDADLVENAQDCKTKPVVHNSGDIPLSKVAQGDFRSDIYTRFWMTYRSHFYPIPSNLEASLTISVILRNLSAKHEFTSDTGWGCMIRSAQSLLANALQILRLGRDWRAIPDSTDCWQQNTILSCFADDPTAPFSIHQFVRHGATHCGKNPGEWFGPSAAARCIQALVHSSLEQEMLVYVNCDGGDVYSSELFRLARSRTAKFTPILILLGVRLGTDNITRAYWDSVKSCLSLPHSTGIAGGRPASSHYFFAYQGDELFYLDPHHTQPALPYYEKPQNYSSDEVSSCHTDIIRRVSMHNVDPSMLVSFLIRSEDDWNDWAQAVTSFPESKIVHVREERPDLHTIDGIAVDLILDDPLDDEEWGTCLQ